MEVETLPPYPKEVYIPTDVALRDSLSKVVSSDLRTCTETSGSAKAFVYLICSRASSSGPLKKASESRSRSCSLLGVLVSVSPHGPRFIDLVGLIVMSLTSLSPSSPKCVGMWERLPQEEPAEMKVMHRGWCADA